MTANPEAISGAITSVPVLVTESSPTWRIRLIHSCIVKTLLINAVFACASAIAGAAAI